jgi:PAS domain S-box-containing protein
MIVFAPQNLVMDPPFTRLSILSCRNVLIYLTQETQNKLLPVFHYSLNPGGILFLGSADTVGGFTDQFAAIHRKSRIYRRSQSPLRRPDAVEFPATFASVERTETQARDTQNPALSLQSMADQLVLQRYSWPAVLVNAKGDILYICGKTGKYLEPAAGKASWNILVMAREGVRYELASAFRKTLRQKKAQTLHGLTIEADGGAQVVDIDIVVLDEAEPLRGLLLIVFRDVPRAAETQKSCRGGHAADRSSARLAALERELAHARDELQTIREEMRASQEELTSTNEELQSANEELQSTNEELTTSKEEMQSLNEELQTVNTELQAKVEDLSLTNSDMKNLLNSTDIAIVFLDPELQVRRFTSQAAKIIKLIPGDVGRPITDLASDLHYPSLAEDARQVLQTLVFSEKEVKTRDGNWFAVRIMPYRTLDERIDGVVITFADITKAKSLENELRTRQVGLKRRVARQSSELAKAKESPKPLPSALGQVERPARKAARNP